MRSLLLLLLLTLPLLAQDFILENAVVHSAVGPPQKAPVVVRGGRIESIGGAPVKGLRRIDLAGHHLYPSLIEADTTLGLTEIGAVRATNDMDEVGEVNPNARAVTAFNPDSMLLPVARSAGILIAGVAPRGGRISGQSAALALAGWTPNEMALKAPAGLYIRWPIMSLDRSPEAKPKLSEQLRERQENLLTITEALANARAYHRAHEQTDVKWEAFGPVLRGEIPVVLEVYTVDQIRAALKWAREEKLRFVLLGASQAWRIPDELKGVPIIYTGLVHLPRDPEEGYDVYYKTPALLKSHGVEVALSGGGDAAHVRNLSDFAGRARAYGMSDLDALQAITLSPAKILGIDSEVGSLEPGKRATFFVADGDILDTRSRVLRAWMDGVELDLEDRQKRLYRKYRDRPARP